MRAASRLGLLLSAWAAACTGPGPAQPPDAAVASPDLAGAPTAPDAGTPPPLGVYTVALDGSGLRLLLDPGTRGLSHVRALPGTDWLTATRYHHDADGDGLAVEDEAGAHYLQTEIVIFQQASPATLVHVAGDEPGRVCANSSWTDDRRLVFIQQDGATPDAVRLKRASFSTLPSLAAIEVIPTPAGLFSPVDPHQLGPSDARGTLVFSATFQHPTGWMRPVWQMPASGATTLSADLLVGCPLCAGGCCAFASPEEVLGTNDPRLDHAGTRVTWMQQHPDLAFDVGRARVNPWRQHVRALSPGGVQAELPASGVASTTTLSFPEWSADDRSLVYWTIELVGGVVKNRLYHMQPDGSARTQIPLPPELCPAHPSHLDGGRLVFNAWRCRGAACSCG